MDKENENSVRVVKLEYIASWDKMGYIEEKPCLIKIYRKTHPSYLLIFSSHRYICDLKEFFNPIHDYLF